MLATLSFQICRMKYQGLRVEYKANLDEAVRRAIPKVISSFANSLGALSFCACTL